MIYQGSDVYLIKHKSQVFDKFKEYQSIVENKLKRISKFFDPIEKENTYLINFLIILGIKAFSLNGPLLIHHS